MHPPFRPPTNSEESRFPTRLATVIAVALLAAGCSSGDADEGEEDYFGPVPCDPSTEYCGNIPMSADACSSGEYWPLNVRSGQRPLTIHYSRLTDTATAEEMLSILEHSWTVQVDELGFAPPLDDGGACGPDGRYDVFIWPGVDGAYVASVTENPATPHNDYSTYMAINPYGVYGGGLLDTTLAHEFNHAVQASDDWWESATIFEMSATFVEALVYPEQDDYFYTLEDFQATPQWSVFYNDDYETWHMYGAAMFLHFLKENYFPNDPGFIARVWQASRSPPPDDRPDYLDAIREVLLTERGVDLDEAIVEFMQWRWFVAEFDDGAHFEHGADWPVPVSYQQLDAAEASIDLPLEAMSYGGVYLRIVNDGTAERTFAVDLTEDDMDAAWHLTAVDGSDVFPALAVPAESSRTIVATALPSSTVSASTLSFDPRQASLRLTAQ